MSGSAPHGQRSGPSRRPGPGRGPGPRQPGLVGPVVVGVLLVAAGLYLRTDRSATGDFLGAAFVAVGLLSVAANLLLMARSRR